MDSNGEIRKMTKYLYLANKLKIYTKVRLAKMKSIPYYE